LLSLVPPPPRSTLFPYTTLFRSGKTGKHIPEEKALDYVVGYCTANDLSARDLQKRTSQWMLGKTNDGFAPVGPYFVTKDEIDNPDRKSTRLNSSHVSISYAVFCL